MNRPKKEILSEVRLQKTYSGYTSTDQEIAIADGIKALVELMADIRDELTTLNDERCYTKDVTGDPRGPQS